MNLPWHPLALFGGYLLSVNLIAFCLMGLDKRRAKRGQWRISERTLFLFPLLGGTLGGIWGMKQFRHKTKHWYFRFGLPVLLALQIVGILFIWYFIHD